MSIPSRWNGKRSEKGVRNQLPWGGSCGALHNGFLAPFPDGLVSKPCNSLLALRAGVQMVEFHNSRDLGARETCFCLIPLVLRWNC